ncbi:hypothetical protein N473_12965 [Pseudoalteromonas luteoviolacea CPMOR-1]|uniref:ABM domain-containing protein n=1 Tax=Pseudoalteromonas luteoviolacea CPMOR-1 TaxID=1365248 RepID=A0A162CA21_9GAMM|nr:hypothetical protein [Pseudoalteromonas luteoviolacea]KZN64696.1 hypothetical protein N473_12965 [Pseudoalteromonas luteoviolacea CPMOR-1]
MSVKVMIECNLAKGKIGDLDAFLSANVPIVRCFFGGRVISSFDEHSAVMMFDEDWHSISHHQKYMQFINNMASYSSLNRLCRLPQ